MQNTLAMREQPKIVPSTTARSTVSLVSTIACIGLYDIFNYYRLEAGKGAISEESTKGVAAGKMVNSRWKSSSSNPTLISTLRPLDGSRYYARYLPALSGLWIRADTENIAVESKEEKNQPSLSSFLTEWMQKVSFTRAEALSQET